jgi:hypothetical protein
MLEKQANKSRQSLHADLMNTTCSVLSVGFLPSTHEEKILLFFRKSKSESKK